MDSHSAPRTIEDRSWPLTDILGTPTRSVQGEETSRPVSPLSGISSADVQSHDDLRVDEIISFGPVRTIHIKRNSVLRDKPQSVITNSEGAPRNDTVAPSSSTLLRTEDSGHARRHLQRGPFSKIGIWTLLVLVLGTALILGAFGFLIYLWLSRDTAWRSIAVNNWMARSVTITVMAIRAAVVFQAAAATAMIAAIQLEKDESRQFRSAKLSISRAAATQPYSLLTGRILPRSSWFLLAATALLTLTTLGLQFASTILLSDFKIGSFVDERVSSSTRLYGLDSNQQSLIENSEPDYSRVLSSDFPSFAEYFQAAQIEQSVDDTGETIRALLPISSSATRQSLASFEGQATLLNSRVICMAPTIENVTYISKGPSTSPASPTAQVEGSINMGGYLPTGMNSMLSGNDTGLSVPQNNNMSFSCSFQFSQSDNEWPISMCSVDNKNVNLSVTSPFTEGIKADTSVYVLLNHTVNGTIPIAEAVNVGSGGSIGYQEVSISNWSISTNTSGAWTNLTYVAHSNFSIQLSLCFTSFGALDAEIDANGTSNRTEPTVTTGKGGNVFTLDVDDVLVQLGVSNTNLTSARRGILDLKPQSSYGSVYNVTAALNRTFGFSRSKLTYGLCTFCGSYAADPEDGTALGIDCILSAIFQQALRVTGSPAKALQALFTIANQNQYYSRLPFFNLASTSTTTALVQAYFPSQQAGLIAVGVLLCAHLVFVVSLTGIFLMKTEFSLLHQSWQSVAQVAADMDAESVLYASGATDREFRAWKGKRIGNRAMVTDSEAKA